MKKFLNSLLKKCMFATDGLIKKSFCVWSWTMMFDPFIVSYSTVAVYMYCLYLKWCPSHNKSEFGQTQRRDESCFHV